MSIFNWFANKQAKNKATTPDSSGFGKIDTAPSATLPDKPRVKSASSPAQQVANRKTERLERRELVYSVVRDAMTRAGVLATGYKFKVLSLDSGGRQYLIMMDLADQTAGDTGRLAEIEAVIAQSAKMRHDILVTAVYWRVNEQVTAGLSKAQPVTQATSQARVPAPSKTSGSPAASSQASRYEPLLQDEVVAFKRALAGAASAVPLAAPGQIVASGPRHPTPAVEFEDTQILAPERQTSPLSVTQYGDLN